MTDVSAVLVTRGDVDLAPVVYQIKTAGIREVIVWSNARRENVGVYGRYAAIDEASNDVIYVQDDDCFIDVATVVAAYEPGRLVANMPESRWQDYPDSTLVGWGAVFRRDLPRKAFEEFANHRREDTLYAICSEAGRVIDGETPRTMLADTFCRTCDVVFSALTPRTVIDVGFTHRRFAEAPNRMFKQHGHKEDRDMVLNLCRQIRGDEDDDKRGEQ